MKAPWLLSFFALAIGFAAGHLYETFRPAPAHFDPMELALDQAIVAENGGCQSTPPLARFFGSNNLP